jgi:CspA family cold shock protein
MARATGELVKWLPDRGFGFITPDSAGHDVFVSIDAFRDAGIEAPVRGERFSFNINNDRQGRPRAEDLRPEGAAAAAERAFKHEPVRP